MSAEEQDIARRLQELQADATWLLTNQELLDRRLERVENSLIFRTLRSMGRWYGEKVRRQPLGKSYATWRKEGGGSLVPPFADEAAIEAVRRDYVFDLGERDQLDPAALSHIAAAGGADIIYTDEEVLDASGAPVHPIFKPDWSPVLLRSVNYLGGLTAVRRKLMEGHPGIAAAVRAAHKPKVVHIPAVLYGSRARTLAPAAVTNSPPAGDAQVSIIICSRTAQLLETCLAGVRDRTDYPRFELIVVQHLGSSAPEEEAAVERAISKYGAKRVPYPGAFNFADMNNRGAEVAGGRILLFLNDDVDPLKPDWLRRMAHWLEDTSIGAVGAKLTFPDGALQHAGVAAWMTAGAWHPGRRVPPSAYWPWNQYTREVSAVTGACLAIRTADFRRLNGFDTAFPINFNDVDLCFRLQETGLAVVVDVEAELRHDESRTRTKGASYEERRLFFRKWSARLQRSDPYYTPHLVQNNEELLLRDGNLNL